MPELRLKKGGSGRLGAAPGGSGSATLPVSYNLFSLLRATVQLQAFCRDPGTRNLNVISVCIVNVICIIDLDCCVETFLVPEIKVDILRFLISHPGLACWGREGAGPGTHTDSYFRHSTACLRPDCFVQSHLKKKKYTKMFLGILRFYLCKK